MARHRTQHALAFDAPPPEPPRYGLWQGNYFRLSGGVHRRVLALTVPGLLGVLHQADLP